MQISLQWAAVCMLLLGARSVLAQDVRDVVREHLEQQLEAEQSKKNEKSDAAAVTWDLLWSVNATLILSL